MRVEGEEVASIGEGLVVLVGVREGDTDGDAEKLARKLARLRVFDNRSGRMDRSLVDAGGEALCVSQFTLYGDTSRGLRPSYVQAAAPAEARRLYDLLCDRLKIEGVTVERGVFGATMSVELVNEGPVTLTLDS